MCQFKFAGFKPFADLACRCSDVCSVPGVAVDAFS